MKFHPIKRLRELTKTRPKMILTFIIIGILAILLTIFVWFTPWSERSVDIRTTKPVPLGSKDFYTALESITHTISLPIPKGEEVVVLNNGDEFLPDFLNEINNAKKSITLANYIWKEGIMMDQIFEAITRKANEGIQVKILMDAKGGMSAPKDKLEAFEKAGGKVEKFRPIGIRTITRFNKRTHLRALVIDGRVGYIGGLSFHDEWLGDGTKKDEWRDVMFKMRGYGAQSIQNMFSDLWRQTGGEILTGSDFYPELKPITTDPCAESCFIPLFHAPTPDLEKNLSNFLWLSIMGTKDHIYLETPYLLPNPDIMSALKQKVKEGVKVEILVPGPYVDSRIVQIASRSFYTEILNSGIKIYEYQPAHMHSKVFTADGHWSVIGSANMDNRSSTLNIEGIIGVEDKNLALELERQFEIDKSRSTEVTEGSFKIGITDTLFGRISRLFAKQY